MAGVVLELGLPCRRCVCLSRGWATSPEAEGTGSRYEFLCTWMERESCSEFSVADHPKMPTTSTLHNTSPKPQAKPRSSNQGDYTAVPSEQPQATSHMRKFTLSASRTAVS